MSVTGNAIELPLIRRIFKYVKPYRKIFFLSLFLTLFIAALSPLRPYLIQFTIDKHILHGNGNGLLWMSVLIFGLLIFQTILQYYQTYFTGALGQTTISDLRVQLFDHIISLRLKFFDRTPIGQLVTRCVSDIETINDIFSEGLITILGDILQVVVIVSFMLFIDWKLTLISLSSIPLLLVATYIFKEKTKIAFQDVRNEVSKLNTFLQEHITGISIVQIFSREKEEMKKFEEINGRHRDAHIRSVLYYSIFFPVVEFMSAISLGLLVWYGSKAVLHEHISLGVIVSFIMYINMLFRPIRELADKFNTLQMGMVSSERIFRILDNKEQEENTGTIAPSDISGRIDFEGVWFAYQDDKYVLKDINFHVEPGETLALVGATGAGKSSIINILNRFYKIDKGKVKLDGLNIEDYDLVYLRSQMATVLQDVFLFSDTIANNASLRNSQIEKEAIMAAAEEVGAIDFIRKLPGGFDYNVMERGATLSTGQGQLLSFIRALVYDPKILILDEATSSVDSETEQLIQKAIFKLMEGRTSIVIAHRLSTIQHADRIIVLDKGEIKEQGNHQELLKLNGYYKKLYDLQFSNGDSLQ